MKNKYVASIVSVFVILSISLFVLDKYVPAFGFRVLEIGNSVMLALCLGAYFLVMKQIGKTPGAFVRGVSSATFLKLMVCMIAVLVYVLMNRVNIHKPTVFVLMGIYAVYTVVETSMLSKLAREYK